MSSDQAAEAPQIEAILVVNARTTCLQPFAQGHGLSPTNALDQLRRELRYQLEMCPCSGIDPDAIEIATSSQGL